MTPNVDVTPVTIQINGRIIGKFCPIFQLNGFYQVYRTAGSKNGKIQDCLQQLNLQIK